MRKYLNNPWVVGSLAAAALAVAAHAFMAGPDFSEGVVATADAAPDPVSPPLAAAAPAAPQANIDAALSAALPAALVRDPFGPTAAAVAAHAAGPLHLSGLWTENGRTLGILNGKIVQAGDRVGTVTIVDASSNGLVLEDDDRRGLLAVGEAWTPSPR